MNKNRTSTPDWSYPNIDCLSRQLDCLYWHGRSGRKYIHTVFSFADWPGHTDANILLVRRDARDDRQIIWAGQSGAVAGLLSDPGALAGAKQAGANEIHVHLLGEDMLMRQCIVEDLMQGEIAVDPAESSSHAAHWRPMLLGRPV